LNETEEDEFNKSKATPDLIKYRNEEIEVRRKRLPW